MLIVIIFLVGALLNVRFNYFGAFSASEVLLVSLAPWILMKMMDLWKSPRFKIIFCLLSIYLLAQIFSDIYRHSLPSDYLRGWARIAVTLYSFTAIAVFCGESPKLIFSFLLGVGFSSLFYYGATFDPDEMDFAAKYKFGLGFLIAVSIFYLWGYFTSRSSNMAKAWACVIPVVMGIWSLFLNSRSMAGLLFITALVALLVPNFRRYGELRLVRMTVFIIIIATTCLIVVRSYGFFAARGVLGELAYEKYNTQREIKGKFSILSGRDEIYYTLPKILKSPLIGWGSWHTDLTYVIDRGIEIGGQDELVKNAATETGGLVPTHSHLFGSFMEAGIGGALIWIYALYLSFIILIRGAFNTMGNVRYCVLLFLLVYCWDIIFSPYGGERRVVAGFFLALLVVLAERIKPMEQRLRVF